MKPLFIAALLGAVITATTNVAVAAAADPNESIFITAQVTKDGEVVHKFASPVRNGHEIPFRDTETITFRESAKGNSKKQVVHMGHQDVGFVLDVLPRVMSTGEVMVKVDVTQSKLIDLRTHTVDGLTIDTPDIREHHFESSRAVASGNTFDIPFQDADGEYVLKVTATRKAQ